MPEGKLVKVLMLKHHNNMLFLLFKYFTVSENKEEKCLIVSVRLGLCFQGQFPCHYWHEIPTVTGIKCTLKQLIFSVKSGIIPEGQNCSFSV